MAKRLSEKLRFWRAERPSEWIMDEFIKEAEILEAICNISNPEESDDFAAALSKKIVIDEYMKKMRIK